MTASSLLVSVALAVGPLDDFEDAMDTLTLGPTVSAHALLDRDGVAPAFAAGFSVVWFDVEKIYEPGCVEHRQSERNQLGAAHSGALDAALGAAQQECRVVGSTLDLNLNIGAELEVAVRRERELGLRTWATVLDLWRTLGLGLTTSFSLAERPSGTAFGIRMGLELQWHQRLGRRGWRPVIQPFLRGEVALIGRATFTDQVSAGVRFVFDL